MHKNIEVLIGRLATDSKLRARFAEDARALLQELVERGLELTGVEIDALARTAPDALRVFAASLDRRLRHGATPTINEGGEL